jgi:hypothetical protein
LKTVQPVGERTGYCVVDDVGHKRATFIVTVSLAHNGRKRVFQFAHTHRVYHRSVELFQKFCLWRHHLEEGEHGSASVLQ